MSSDWYDIHGRCLGGDASSWSNRGPGSDWEKAHLVTKIGDTTVSTVWLSLDHSSGSGPPLIFETLVTGGGLDQEMDRYPTLESSQAGHDRMVEKVRAEATAFSDLTSDPAIADAVQIVQSAIASHLQRFDAYDYDGRAYRRLADAILGGAS